MKKKNNQLILALDLSLNLPAGCVAQVIDGEFKLVEIFHIDNKKGKYTTPEKLDRIAVKLKDIFQRYGNFDVVVREKGFSRFANTTQLLFRVVGVADLIAYQEGGIKVIEELPPTVVKSIVAGYSKADKLEVEEGVRQLLSQDQKEIKFYSNDESDAVAVALTYCIKKGLLN